VRRGGIREYVLWLVAIVVAACSIGCSDVSVKRYKSVKDARADRLFDRGWVPDVLPDEAGPLIEAHNIDTNDVCAKAEFEPPMLDSVLSAVAMKGFQHDEGPLAPTPPRACPFRDADITKDWLRFRKADSGGPNEFIAVDKGGTLLYWSSRWR
jgi:hypothetical protein